MTASGKGGMTFQPMVKAMRSYKVASFFL